MRRFTVLEEENGGSISSKFEQALQLLDLFNISS
ncbi:hypothetical protein LINPERPRIM_LOCUS14682 [Linum perenne]